MDQGHLDLGGAAFWIFIAAAVWSSVWAKARREAEKHETLRRIIDKTGVVDEAKLKELFAPPPTPDWLKSPPSVPGGGFRALRIAGTIVMGCAGALAALALCIRQFGPASAHTGSVIALSMSLAIACVGLAIFVSSRFAVPPPDRGTGRER